MLYSGGKKYCVGEITIKNKNKANKTEFTLKKKKERKFKPLSRKQK